ncbi:protein N-lysine methyltransferase METTL21D-like [Uloborus diversus]|uniref:protein N-lysine methyltransferase METTL21D-like n=1 Tax=Uloborus diversus TaxID=327109 RepID=UPI00240A9C4B|nr:protein N-lysine methyltransferase METTL21D-like [Uloborus diversus]
MAEVATSVSIPVKNDTDGNFEFVRELEVESCDKDLKIHQYTVGDVGCVVWDAGIALAKYLDHSNNANNSFVSKTVIDIGSGTGVVGLFAAALGADVLLTDLPEFIPLIQKNIESNQDILKGSASASVLVWGEDVDKYPTPDIILVSDCIYYDKSVECLVPTLVNLASNKTEVLISYEDRIIGNKKELLKQFLEELKKSFQIQIIHPSEQHPHFQSPDIHLLKCKLKNAHGNC